MKKMFVMAVAAALCGVALAQGQTHGYANFVNYAPLDPSPRKTSVDYYSCYIISSDTVSSPTGMEAWLTENGGLTRENIASKGTAVGVNNFTWDFDEGQYKWQVDDVSPLMSGGANKYVVMLAAIDKTAEAPDFAYEIMQGSSSTEVLDTYWRFNDTNEGSVTWTAAPVPEPTSGVLLLLGIAGLALKRKRA